jgi:N-acetyl-anhydromuramyl-L-alanine amidase AmpD
MNIKQDDRIFNKFFKPVSENFRRNISIINELVIHGTGGSASAKALLNWMLSGERESQYVKGEAIFHYAIDLNGDIYSIIPNNFFVYHSSCGRHDKFTIGIELINTRINNLAPYTIFQYNALFALIKYLLNEYEIKTITSHNANKQKYSGGIKACPGEKFNWSLLEQNFDLKLIDKERYELHKDIM